MRTSVYVPDELWAAVRAITPEAGASQLLQECLQSRLAQPQERPGGAQVGEDALRHQRELQEKVRAGVARAYLAGYDFGLDFMAGLEPELWPYLEAADYDLTRFASLVGPLEVALPDEPGNVYDFDGHWRSESSNHGELFMDAEFDQLPRVVRRGIEDALRETWEGAAAPEARELLERSERSATASAEEEGR